MSAVTFERVERRTVPVEIRERVVEAIRAGHFPPGAPLPAERVLCEEFGVARTSVREAIQGLITAGYLERRGNRSVVVERLPAVRFEADDRKILVSQLFEVRKVIEPAIAELATTRASDDERAEIAELAAQDPSDLDEFRAIDRQFHAALARACGNPLLTEVHAKLLAALFGSGEFASLLYAEFNRAEVRRLIESAVGAHRAIASAIAKGDRKRAGAASVSHLEDVERRMVERLR